AVRYGNHLLTEVAVPVHGNTTPRRRVVSCNEAFRTGTGPRAQSLPLLHCNARIDASWLRRLIHVSGTSAVGRASPPELGVAGCCRVQGRGPAALLRPGRRAPAGARDKGA